MPSTPDIANDAAATFAAYPELVTKVDAGTVVPDSELNQWIGATYTNFVDACITQVNEVMTGQRSIAGPLRVDSAGIAANADADDILIGDATGNHGMTIAQSTAGRGTLYFWTSRSDNEAVMFYDAGSRCLVLSAGRDVTSNASLELCANGTDGSLAPRFSNNTDLGKTAYPFRDLHLQRHQYITPDTAPATPSSGAVLYVDSATGDLVVKFSTGTTTVLASP